MVIGMVSELAEGAFIVDLDQLHKQQSLDHENPKLPCMTMKEIMQNINKDDMTLTRHAEIFKNAWFWGVAYAKVGDTCTKSLV